MANDNAFQKKLKDDKGYKRKKNQILVAHPCECLYFDEELLQRAKF